MKSPKIAVAILAIMGSIHVSNAQSAWDLSGNSISSGQFLGTTNDQPFEIRRNNQPIFKVDLNSAFSLGKNIYTNGFYSNNSFAIGKDLMVVQDNSYAIGENITIDNPDLSVGPQSFALGFNISTRDPLPFFAIGRGLDPSGGGFVLGTGSSTWSLTAAGPNTLSMGFNSDIPTFFIGSSTGAGTTGNVGIGTTSPGAKLHVNGDLILHGSANSAIYLNNATNEQNTYLQILNSPLYSSAGGLKTGGLVVSDDHGFANPGKSDAVIKGKLGIGTASVLEKLDVNGNINMAGVNGRRIYMGGVANGTFGIAYDRNNPNYGIFYTEGANDYVSISPNGNANNGVMNIFGQGMVGIGTNSPENTAGWNQVLEVKGSAHAKSLVSTSSIQSGMWSHNSGYFGANAGGITGTTTNHPFSFITNSSMRMMITADGNVAIGTTCVPSGYKMAVKGYIMCEGVKVRLEGGNCWADYVFEPSYKLLSLKEVEQYIQSNKHLPGVPSAAEVAKEGVGMIEMDATLLKKIEELTLYTIELQKQVDELKKANSERNGK